ncbi:MAG: hypothetical protein PHD97_10895 [Bacteroidales bacterium]|nr:hypothetical protein [Bacteroidales bacterium]
MRKTISPIHVICAAIFFLAFSDTNIKAQDARSALAYMNGISVHSAAISKDLWDYMSAASHGKGARKVEKRRQELIETIYKAKNIINRMPKYNNDGTYRDSVVSFLKLDYLVLKEDFDKILDMEDIAEQSYDKMEAYMLAKQKASEKLNKANEMVNKIEEDFAKANGITLTEEKSKLSQKIEAANKVFDYYNKLYLVFFKGYKQEWYVLEAFNKSDINAAGQNRNALINTSKECLKKLDTIKSFNGDATLKMKCQKMLQFYEKEATSGFLKMMDFYLKKENFEKVKAAFDAKPESKRKNEDIDEFNKAVKEYNDAIKDFNIVQGDLNKNRNMLLDQWNNGVEEFLDKHVPPKK